MLRIQGIRSKGYQNQIWGVIYCINVKRNHEDAICIHLYLYVYAIMYQKAATNKNLVRLSDPGPRHFQLENSLVSHQQGEVIRLQFAFSVYHWLRQLRARSIVLSGPDRQPQPNKSSSCNMYVIRNQGASRHSHLITSNHLFGCKVPMPEACNHLEVIVAMSQVLHTPNRTLTNKSREDLYYMNHLQTRFHEP